MPSRSKSKGNAWELDVAKFLTDTYKTTFLRIPSSGAFVGGKNSSRKAFLDKSQLQSRKGDIHPPHTWKYFNCECKNYGTFPFHQLWTSDLKMLDQWVLQQKEVEDPGDLNLIFVKITRRDKWIMYPAELKFQVNRSLVYKGWAFTSWEDFWSNNYNIELVKEYSTNSVNNKVPA